MIGLDAFQILVHFGSPKFEHWRLIGMVKMGGNIFVESSMTQPCTA